MMSSASRSHKDAERRRRQRINAHLSTLRTLLPNAAKVCIFKFSLQFASLNSLFRSKRRGILGNLGTCFACVLEQTDKATLLAQVVEHVKELRKKADDVARQDGDACGAASEGGLFPGEADEATLSYCEVGEKEMKATLCCEDRPGLNLDLARAIRSVRARAVRAEMMTVGGRTKSVVAVKWAANGAGGEEEIAALERALKAVVQNRASGSGLGRAVSGNKRTRFYGSFDEGDNAFLLSGL
jgi:hypothetical protein